MTKKYKPQEIEKKWQKHWEEKKLARAEDFSKKPKQYILVEFPYPSGNGLHVGHIRSYTALDVVARKKRMEGSNVLYPMGWDAFGLPTENYALKTGIHPQKVTEKNVAQFKKQMKSLGFSFDWSREINTTDPKYYKWTQWIFIKLFEKGLAYQAKIPINWCPSCKIGLANEEVVEGKCERCGAPIEKKVMKQWMLKITSYADRLIDDLEKVDYLEKIKTQQINWIGRSEGTEVEFKLVDFRKTIKVFTTRPDTLFGVTALVLTPEHSLVNKLVTPDNRTKVTKYVKESLKKSEFKRTKLEKEKTGVFTGAYCFNPINGEKVPIWIGDYVVATYGGGSVMVVPAHDKRDYQLAKKYGLEIREVVSGGNISKEAYVDYGKLINSGQFNKLKSQKAIEKITQWLEKKNLGKKTTQYKLRDWVFSRQHYWGEPIPIIHCSKCGSVPVPEKDLPVELPYVKKYQPTGTGKSPLAAISKWVNTKCPKCKSPAKRETDTMPNWAGSNWYFMRYIDPDNKQSLADSKKLKYWLPVDWYNGGMEHTTLHLLYSRFIYKFLFDIKVAPYPEPYQKRTSQGIVLAEDGRKMSKSFGNVVNPDDIVKTCGADTLRIYELFIGPFDQTVSWNSQGVKGVTRFLERLWRLVQECSQNKKSSPEALRAIHQLNKKIDEDLETAKFNTVVSALMEFVNFGLDNKRNIGKEVIERFILILAPLAPHLAEELWRQLGHKKSIHLESWPKYDSRLAKEEEIELVIQINGRLRDRVKVKANISEKEAKEKVLVREKVKKWLKNKKVKKVIFVPQKLINIVTS
ncbi:MAG TPA: leucine--tRNA ligase [Candidatus Portnoybacteria bacterium]|nr:leucine--tRNA ligase [Candidatus Portnoybacteria bacterium]